MGFPKQRFTGYEPMPQELITNDQFVEDEAAVRLVNNALVVYSHSKRLVASSLGYGPDKGATEDVTYKVSPGNPASIIRLPLSQVVSGASGKIRVTILASRADGVSPSMLEVNAGRDSAHGHFNAGAGVMHLVTAVVDVERNRNPALYSEDIITISLSVGYSYGVGNEETLTVRMVSAYELGDTDKPMSVRHWIDTTGVNNKIGEPDYPFSSAMERILNGNAAACYGHRMPRASIIHRCFRTNKKVATTSYDADNAGMGEWIIRKPRGATTVEATMLIVKLPAGTVRIRLNLYSIESLNYDNEVAPFTAGDLLTGQTQGTQARILKVVDNGTFGTLYLGFGHTSWYGNNEVIKDESGGEALMNGAMQGPASIASDEEVVASTGFGLFSIGSLIEEEGEYWARLDGRFESGTGDIIIPWILIVDGLDSDVAFTLPRSSNVEQDDDVRALTWKKVKTTLEKVWARNRSILASDIWYDAGGQVESKNATYSSLSISELRLKSDGVFGTGIIYPSPGAYRLHVRAWLRRRDVRFVRMVDVSGGTGTAVVDDTVTGATSGATGTLERDAGTYIVVKDISGAYQIGETLNFAPSGATYTADSVPYTFDANLFLKFAAFIDTSGVLVEHEIDVSSIPRNQQIKVELVIPISSEFENDYTVQSNRPYMWILMSKSSKPGDHLLLDKYQVFEETLIPGGFETTIGD